jgi:hypothetical protein
MRDLEKFIADARADLPPKCGLALQFCNGSGQVYFELTGPFSTSPYTLASGTDITEAILSLLRLIDDLPNRIENDKTPDNAIRSILENS